jgi:hypothetical protein
MLPAIFFGHGNPMNTLAENIFTLGWQRIGTQISSPKAILSIQRTGSPLERELRSALHDARSMISEAFRGTYIGSSIRRQQIRNSPGVCTGCCPPSGNTGYVMGVGSRDVVRVAARLSRWKFPSFSSASMKQDRLSSISRWAENWHPCVPRAFG